MDDRFQWFILGCIAGSIFGYIVASLREIRRELAVKRGEDVSGRSRINATNIGLAFVVLITAWAAFASQRASNGLEQNIKDDQVARCLGGVDTRQVQRETVDAVYTLAGTFLEREKGAPPLTEEQVIRVNAYIDRLNAFRDDMYAKIKPSEACEEFVRDDHVKPATPPFQHVTS